MGITNANVKTKEQKEFESAISNIEEELIKTHIRTKEARNIIMNKLNVSNRNDINQRADYVINKKEKQMRSKGYVTILNL